MISPTDAKASSLIDSPTAWLRLGVAVLLSTIGGVGMWSYMVALPAIQADFGVSRADASLPFTMVMFGFAGGGVLMGRLADRFGIALPLGIGTLALTAGYLAVGWSPNLWLVALAHGLIG
ncbi:MAG: MFS transporter, partial [Pseudolabrys sp.]